MWSPNESAPTFGGDGLTIHYNLQYHATYGEGVMLTSQYYPFEEVIFLTDAQGVVAVVLAALRPVFPGISEYAVGVSNGLIFWSNVLSVLLLYLIFRRFGLPVVLSVLFGLLTALMAPQIMRQLGGQYSLGYTFLLPLTILYQLSYRPGRGYWLWSLGMIAVITVLGLNNPYLYAITVAYLLASTFFAGVFRLLDKQTKGAGPLVQWLLVSTLTTLAVYFTIEHLDYASNRVEVPFGFFHNVARWGGLLSNPDTFSYDAVRMLLPDMVEPRRENLLYLGLVPILLLLCLPFTLHYARRLPLFTRAYPWMLGAGAAGLVFAFGLPFSYFTDWTYDHLGVVLQFRAPVRFGWPVYYVLSIGAGIGLWVSCLQLNERKQYLGTAVIGLALLVWGIEAYQYTVGAREGSYEHNAFHPRRLVETRQLVSELGIDTATYSSIYLLPTEAGWSDKIHREGSWRSNHDGYKYSLASGLPLLNGKLSKVPVYAALSAMALISDPLIRPSSTLYGIGDKDILLLISKETELLKGEARLATYGSTVFESDKLLLRRVSPQEINQRTTEHIDSIYPLSTADSTQFLRLGLAAAPSDERPVVEGRRFDKGWQTIAEFPLRQEWQTDSLELSIWNYVDAHRFGGPRLYLRFLDAQGNRLSEMKRWANDATDTQSGWLRLNFTFVPPPGTASLDLVGEYFYPYYLAELLLRPVNLHTRIKLDYGFTSLDNFVIRTPSGTSDDQR